MSDEPGRESLEDERIPREAVEPVVREVVEERMLEYRRQVAVVVAAVVGGGLMIAAALGMAGVALLAPDAWTVLLGLLGAVGVTLFVGGLYLAARD